MLIQHQHRNRVERHYRAFTLIELLIVIAIITILAAILFPVFATAREKARQTTCSSNEKQIGLAFLQYVSDNDECFPGGQEAGYLQYPGMTWPFQIWPYVKNDATFQCPDDLPTPGVSYLYNYNFPKVAPTVSSILRPDITVLLDETNSTGTPYASGGRGGVGYGNCFVQCATNANNYGKQLAVGNIGGKDPNYPNGRHNGGSNFLAADGHVKWLLGVRVSAGANAPGSLSVQSNTNGTASSTDCLSLGSSYLNCGDGSVSLTFSIL